MSPQSDASEDVNPYAPPLSAESPEEPDSSRLIARGGWIFLGIVGINLSPIAWVLATGIAVASPDLGTFLTLALLYFLWRGHRWAKWVGAFVSSSGDPAVPVNRVSAVLLPL